MRRTTTANERTFAASRISRRRTAGSQLMDKSEIVIGYWTGEYFRPMIADYPWGKHLKASHWAMLRKLPKGIFLQSRPEFREDVGE